MDELIYDRTQADITNKTSKGFYNYNDLNRVEEWCRYLADELVADGYSISITTKTDWNAFTFPTYSQMERIRSNIQKIMTGFKWRTTIYTASSYVNYVRANRYEQILKEIYDMFRGMENRYVYCGVSKMGQSRTWQNRFRRQFPVEYYQFDWNDVVELLFDNWDELRDTEWRDYNVIIDN